MADNRHDTRTDHDIQLPDLTNPEFRHEHKDVDFKALGKFAIGLILLGIITLAAMLGLFHYLVEREGGALRKTAQDFDVDIRQRPPAPQLEETPALDWQRQLAAEEEILHSYAWVNRQEGVARIPIDRAIDLITQRGLPTRSQAEQQSAAASDTATVPTASSLGPKMQQEGGPLAAELAAAAKAPAAPAAAPPAAKLPEGQEK